MQDNKNNSNFMNEHIPLSKDRVFAFLFLIRKWDDSNLNDKEFISNICQSSYSQFIVKVREIYHSEFNILKHKNGHWQTRNNQSLLEYSKYIYDDMLENFRTESILVLKSSHPKFDLKPEDRFASAIHGKIPKYSSELRKGISETLAFLGVHGIDLKNCTQHKPEMTTTHTIRELFNDADWKLWASLNDLLPILAEAAPSEFLSSVEKALKQTPSPFDELFSQEGEGGITGANYMTGLYWALETLAWCEEYLTRTILVLAELATHDPGGRWANRPANSITTILLPWLPQTTAPVNKRISSLKGIQRNFPDIAWKSLIRLLPNQHQVSSGSHKPSFRNFIPEDWGKEVTTQDYWEQVRGYASMAVDMAKGNLSYVAELVENLDNIPQPSFNVFLKYLSSEEIVGLLDEQKQSIWETMTSFIRKHRRFSDANWALPVELVNLLEQTANKLEPHNPEILHRHLFTNKDFDFRDKDLDWQTQQERIQNQRIEALKQIYKIKGTKSIIKLIENVDNPSKVGFSFSYLANEENDEEFLPSFLDCQDFSKKQFISGFVSGRYFKNGIKWLNTLNTHNWTSDQKCNLLLLLPFENEIWGKVEEFLSSNVGDYWKKINTNPFPSQSSLFPAIQKLLKYDRPRFAIDCIYAHYFSKKEFFKEQAIKALIEGATSDEPVGAMDTHHVIEIIKMLQDDPEVKEDDLFNIEWAYLPLLNRHNNAKPKLIEKRLSQEPDLFIEAIRLIYRSKNDDQVKEVDEKTSNMATNAWRLLHDWKRPPGIMDNGSFSGEVLKTWVEEVKTKTKDSGHFEMAMKHLGQVLYYAGPVENGLWIQQSVAEILDDNDSDDMRRGFTSEIFSSRGVYTVDPSGKQEKELANQWRKKADDVEKLGFIRFASSLKELANSYDREAVRVISDFGDESVVIDEEKENE